MITVATWNLKQAVAPKKPLPELWDWAERRIGADLMVLTEAKVPKDAPPANWVTQWNPDGIGHRRRWGTVIAGRGVELVPVTEVRVGLRTRPIVAPWDGVLEVADVIIGRERWATIVGMYGLTVDPNGDSCGHGGYSVPALIDTIEPLLDSERGKRLIVAGDMNLWPRDVSHRFERVGLTDLIEWTSNEREPLANCANCNGDPDCGHVWTHRNGNSPRAAVQQIDFIFASAQLRDELIEVRGGVGDFDDAWEVSDHAPVVATFH